MQDFSGKVKFRAYLKHASNTGTSHAPFPSTLFDQAPAFRPSRDRTAQYFGVLRFNEEVVANVFKECDQIECGNVQINKKTSHAPPVRFKDVS